MGLSLVRRGPTRSSTHEIPWSGGHEAPIKAAKQGCDVDLSEKSAAYPMPSLGLSFSLSKWYTYMYIYIYYTVYIYKSYLRYIMVHPQFSDTPTLMPPTKTAWKTRSTARNWPWCKIGFSMIQHCLNPAITMRFMDSL